MKYESILLELMERVKKLEDELEELKAAVLEPDAPDAGEDGAEFGEAGPEPAERYSAGRRRDLNYIKMTDAMIDVCYAYGKKAFENPALEPWRLAGEVAEEAGMRRSSASMYIYVVVCMLEGVAYKRAINATATRKYLDNIYAEYGKEGLSTALHAMEGHLRYRKSLGHQVDSIERIYREYRERL